MLKKRTLGLVRPTLRNPFWNRNTLSQTQLKKYLSYDSTTGIFKWHKSGTGRKPNLSAGCIEPNGYISLILFYNKFMAHRLAWLYVYGKFPKKFIDHVDGNPSNNAIVNLREASRSENAMNMRPFKNSTSKFKGVSWSNKFNKWIACIVRNKERYFLGVFDSELEAAKVYKKKEIELFGEFAFSLRGEHAELD